MEEIEVKFLNIDPGVIEGKLLDLGGVKVFDRLFRRHVFEGKRTKSVGKIVSSTCHYD